MVKELSFMVIGQSIDLTHPARLVAGTVNEYTASFSFDAAWDGYQRTAVFRCGAEEREQLLNDDACMVPWEVLIPGGYLRVGVYGTKGGSRLPTIWYDKRTLFVYSGAGPTQEAAEPSPTLVEQLMQRMGNLEELQTEDKSSLVAAINEILESGVGGSGASVTDAYINENGHLIITLSTGKTIDAGYAVGPAGATGPAGKDGKDGAPGASGADGKSAYQYAQDGGYTGTEAEFTAKLSAKNLELDNTLSAAGKAADAAEVGNQLRALSEEIATLPGGGSGLTTAQVNALDGMFKVVAYDASKDYSGAYDAFKTAFGITDSGGEGSGDGGGNNNVKTYTFSDVQTPSKMHWKIYSDDGSTTLSCNITKSNYVYSNETFEKDTIVKINLTPDVTGYNDCVIGCTKMDEWKYTDNSTASTAYFHYAKLAVAHLLVDTEYNFEYTVKAGYQIVMKFGSGNTVIPTIEVVS